GAFTSGVVPMLTFEQWRGRSVGVAHAFVSDASWAEIEVSSSWASNWGKSAFANRMLLTIPMLPKDTSTTMQLGASGAYDSHFVKTAQRLVANGMGNATIRIGH